MEEKDSWLESGELEDDEYRAGKGVGDLAAVGCLREALERFGFREEDFIERRDAVLIYRSCESEMRAAIREHTDAGRFDEAKALEQTLTGLKQAFLDHQMHSEQRKNEQQGNMLRQSRKIMFNKLAKSHTEHEAEIEGDCHWKDADMAQTHQIETENLHLDIGHIPRPRMKYSKNLLDLQKAEESLVKMREYDDAKNVRRMINKILPGEEERFNANFDRRIEKKMADLTAKQEEDIKRLNERLSAQRWKGIRQREKEHNVTELRVKHHEKDMGHMHLMHMSKHPELSVNPSANWQNRASHVNTSAHLRGQQLLGQVKGKKQGQAVFVAGLCDIHSFENPEDGTVHLAGDQY